MYINVTCKRYAQTTCCLQELPKIITARIRRMGEGNNLTCICLSVHTDGGGLDGGTPINYLMGEGFPHPSNRTGGGTPIPGLDRGCPVLDRGRDVSPFGPNRDHPDLGPELVGGPRSGWGRGTPTRTA